MQVQMTIIPMVEGNDRHKSNLKISSIHSCIAGLSSLARFAMLQNQLVASWLCESRCSAYIFSSILTSAMAILKSFSNQAGTRAHTSMYEIPKAWPPVIPVAVCEHVEVVHLAERLLCARARLKHRGKASKYCRARV